jgi:hypothetical protein
MTDKTPDYPEPFPHDDIEEIMPDLYMFRGTIKFKPLVNISRNMAIIKHGKELTLVNPIRLSEKGEEQLKQLGEVKRIIRLGVAHGRDDGNYKDTFNAELWAPGTSPLYKEPEIDHIVTQDEELPFPDAELMVFNNMKIGKDGMLLIKRNGGCLLACDSLQYYGDQKHHSLLASLMLPFMGFKGMCIGPPWLKAVTPEGSSLKPDFDRILRDWEFEKFFSAHGCLCKSGAKDLVRDAVDKAFE